MNAKDLIDACERGLKKGYWHNDLIPELRKRLERNEPKKVLDGNGSPWWGVCPSCGKSTSMTDDEVRLINFCPSCGQRLDWSDRNVPND